MNTLRIEDLSRNDAADANARARSLSPEEMKQVCGGRSECWLTAGPTPPWTILR